MNIWHDINPDRIKKDDFVAVIEISKGGTNKYELDKETGLLKLDRVLYTATHYPANYGFIPRTYAGDGDPLDVLVLCHEKIVSMALVEVYPIGVLKMIDGYQFDEKIIGEILDTNEKVDVTYKDFDGLDKEQTSDVTPKIRLTKIPVDNTVAPAPIPKAGSSKIALGFIVLITIVGILGYKSKKIK